MEFLNDGQAIFSCLLIDKDFENWSCSSMRKADHLGGEIKKTISTGMEESYVF